jgi:hypothetical protein
MACRILTDLPSLLELVREHWFDLDEMQFDESGKQLDLYLGWNKRGPYRDKRLTITGVVAVAVEDEARISIYNLADILLDPATVTLVSSFPLKIVVTVEEQHELHLRDLHATEDSQVPSPSRSRPWWRFW